MNLKKIISKKKKPVRIADFYTKNIKNLERNSKNFNYQQKNRPDLFKLFG